MSTRVTTLQADQPLTAGTDHLLRDQPGSVPVVDGAGRLLGMVSYLDALSGRRSPC
jgi:CBS-domain-containing membrane protein